MKRRLQSHYNETYKQYNPGLRDRAQEETLRGSGFPLTIVRLVT